MQARERDHLASSKRAKAFRTRKSPDEAHRKLRAAIQAGYDVIWLGFEEHRLYRKKLLCRKSREDEEPKRFLRQHGKLRDASGEPCLSRNSAWVQPLRDLGKRADLLPDPTSSAKSRMFGRFFSSIKESSRELGPPSQSQSGPMQRMRITSTALLSSPPRARSSASHSSVDLTPSNRRTSRPDARSDRSQRNGRLHFSRWFRRRQPNERSAAAAGTARRAMFGRRLPDGSAPPIAARGFSEPKR